MALHKHGATSGLHLQPGTTISTDTKGLTTARCVWKCQQSDLSTHEATTLIFPLPGYNHLKAEKHHISLEKGGWAFITTEFAGTTYDLEENADPVYELIIGTSEEPIETHPHFANFAGTPSAPLKGAIFLDPETNLITTDNNKGVFYGFAATSDKAGVVSYLAGRNITYRKTWTQQNKPISLGGVGSIDSPTGAPSVGDGYNWLYIGMSFTKRGDHYSCSREWKLSGPGGWDSDIY